MHSQAEKDKDTGLRHARADEGVRSTEGCRHHAAFDRETPRTVLAPWALRKSRYDRKTCHDVALANPHVQSVEVFGQSCMADCARRVRDALFDAGVELASAIVDKLAK
jgi:hypothetical protein